MDPEVRKILAQKPIVWTGDLNDDCSAIWAGMTLRAEKMDDNDWWWAVFEWSPSNVTGSEDEIDSSNNYNLPCKDGETARLRAEDAAKRRLPFKY